MVHMSPRVAGSIKARPRMKPSLTRAAVAVACALAWFAGCSAGRPPHGAASRTPERNTTMQNQTSDLARKLMSRAYGDFFVLPAHEQTINRVWADPQNRPVLEALVADPAQPIAARF